MPTNYCSKCGKPAGFNPTNGLPNKLCKSCFQKGKVDNKVKTVKSPLINKKPKFEKRTFVAKTIDIESLYRKLKSSLEKRAGYQEAQENLWKFIKKTESNRSAEMERIDNEIGKNTHEINIILSELTQYKKTHKAMNLAYNYLQNEINRTKKIIEKWRETISKVEGGRSVLITSEGNTHTNTNNARNYVKKKNDQLLKLEKWSNHIRNYME